MNSCHDPQQVRVGYMADLPLTTCFEPKGLAEKDERLDTPLNLPQTEYSFDLRFC